MGLDSVQYLSSYGSLSSVLSFSETAAVSFNSPNTPLILCADKRTTRAEPREVRRSARLRDVLQSEASGRRNEWGTGLSSDDTSRDLVQPVKSKRKRAQEAPAASIPTQCPPAAKRPRKAAWSTAECEAEGSERKLVTGAADPLRSWVQNQQWPREYFEPDDQAREELQERDSWLDDIMAQPPIPAVRYVERNGFRYPRPAKRSATSLRRKRSGSSLNESGDQKEPERESRSTLYRDARYVTMLETKRSFMRDFDHEVPQATTDICLQLLTNDQMVPQNSLFTDNRFGRLCGKLHDKNEAIIIQDLTHLIVPSAMNLAIHNAHLDVLIESANEVWLSSIPVEGPWPQPDYAVGFDRSAFTNEQLTKLGPLVGDAFDTSFFVATSRMYFPFLTCEFKCGPAALDIADRQNAHSMTIAVRSVVELYKAVKREKELDREILAFSVSHDHRSVRIYGHYPVMEGDDVSYYRHPVHEFSFRTSEGKDKWTGYRFTKNVYDAWMPTHLKRICSAVDQLPLSLDFEGSEVPFEEATGLTHDMERLLSESSSVDHASQDEDEPKSVISQAATPNTSISSG
ncbi:hypothetical protein AYL99_09912 [Fonsecaea erecta]|uniref:DUF7924 domain-containing protein n=1 Tax=Fonsecaea erecta TaxID=1367422 RepID=A0A178Z7K3_9EURO|nr:hypothetical protein AYL99_09912 [Fonsecaea erecta]OAP55760.1 hypothetical protein AYL99_09912 [Fonsecaea erecta]